jgi:hypothetical protein
MAAVLAYAGAALVAVWGVAHTIPTRQVLASFEPITADNRRPDEVRSRAAPEGRHGGDSRELDHGSRGRRVHAPSLLG